MRKGSSTAKMKKQNLEIFNIKIDKTLRKKLQANADKFAGGNLSQWLRYAGLNFTPKKGEHIISIESIPDFY